MANPHAVGLPDLSEGLSLQIRACREGYLPACDWLRRACETKGNATASLFRSVADDDPAKAACVSGIGAHEERQQHWIICDQASDLDPVDPVATRFCRTQWTAGCDALHEDRGPHDTLSKLARHRAQYEYECEHGNAQSCALVGSLRRFGLGIPRDLKRAFKLFERACALDDSACVDFALALREGVGTGKDQERAGAAIDRACDGGNAWACAQPPWTP